MFNSTKGECFLESVEQLFFAKALVKMHLLLLLSLFLGESFGLSFKQVETVKKDARDFFKNEGLNFLPTAVRLCRYRFNNLHLKCFNQLFF